MGARAVILKKFKVIIFLSETLLGRGKL
jgi:hypothetical protein